VEVIREGCSFFLTENLGLHAFTIRLPMPTYPATASGYLEGWVAGRWLGTLEAR
jgi:hypothetical protein